MLPRLGGLTRDAAGLRHARPGFLVAAVELRRTGQTVDKDLDRAA